MLFDWDAFGYGVAIGLFPIFVGFFMMFPVRIFRRMTSSDDAD